MFGWKLSQLFLLLICLCSVSRVVVHAQDGEDHDEPAAKVVLYKFSDTNPVVEGQDFVITYELVNVGNAAATMIEVGDRYDANSFETDENVNEEGIVAKNFEELVPGSHVSFNVTVRPKLSGVYESTRARIRYASGVPIDDVEPDVKQGYSTSLGRTRIISAAEAARNTAYFTRQWLIFVAIYAVPTAIPFLLWNSRK